MDHFDLGKTAQLRGAMQFSRKALSQIQRAVSTAQVTAMITKGPGPSAEQYKALHAATAEDHRATTAYFAYLDEMTRKAAHGWKPVGSAARSHR